MTGFVVFLGFVFLGLIGCAICGNLGRIADAIEAQNRAYGIAETEAMSGEVA